MAIIYQTQLNWSPLENEPELKQVTYSNRYISFTTYEAIEEFIKETDKSFEKVLVLQTETSLNRIEFRYFHKNKKNSTRALRIKDGELYKIIEGLTYPDFNFYEFMPHFGYIICFKPDSLCLCIDYDRGGWSPADFPASDIIAIKKLNYISLNTESELYFDQSKLIKNLDYVYQDSTSKYPCLFQYYQEKYLKDDFVLQDDTKVIDILSFLNAKNHTGKKLVSKDLLSMDTWIEKKHIKKWGGVFIGTYSSFLRDLVLIPEK